MVINVHDGGPAPEKKSGGCGGGCSTGQCGSGLEKIYPTAVIRYGYMKSVGEFHYPDDTMKFGCGADVIIQTNRGIEMGEMVSITCDGCDKCVSREQIRQYVDNSGPSYFHFSNGKILRLATQEDVADWEHIRAESLRKKQFCQEHAEKAKLDMKVLECEHLFGGERIIFYFMAEGRIDFRTLVRGLADEFQTRIEMRQVGARDEARLLADYETCGRECCCKNFLKELRPISMKMAKMQKATLDPAKVSGRCGRLKCCLRYEHTNYEDLNRKLPNIGRKVFTDKGPAMVVGRQILTQLLQVQTDDGGRFAVAVEDLIDEAEAARLEQQRAEEAARVAAAAQARRDADAARHNESRDAAARGRRGRRGGDQPRTQREPAPSRDATGPPANADAADKPAQPPAQTGPASRAEDGESSTAPTDGSKRRRRRRGRRPPRARRPGGESRSPGGPDGTGPSGPE
jgi:cell fate regulator YaaT (PSP1 superfamily)